MRNSTDTRRGRRGADGQRLVNRQPQKKMSGTSKTKGKGSSGVGKNRDEMKKADQHWANDPRWKGISRNYSISDVRRLQGNVIIEHTLARRSAEKLWSLLQTEPFINALGALTGNQALQQVRAGLKAIYLSGWQVAADANLAGQMYPDQSLYPVNSVPQVIKRINQALQRADQSHDRGRRRRRSLRRSTRLREKVRPYGRQGADCNPAGDQKSDRRAPGRRCDGRADCDYRPHRRERREPADQRYRRARPAVLHWRAHRRRVLSRARRPRPGDCARPGLCPAYRLSLVRDLGAESGRGAPLRRSDSQTFPRQVAGV